MESTATIGLAGGSRTVSRLNAILGSSAAVCVLLAAPTSARAEEVEKKFRLGFSLGDYSTKGEVPSAAANRRTVYLPNGDVERVIFDPRNDSAGGDTYGIEGQLGGVLSASYAFNRFWYVEASVGYRTGSVGSVMAQVQFVGAEILNNQPFNFSIYNFDGGKITQVPLELTAGIRFRPKAAFNPYLCAGIGYTFVSYEPSDEINQLSFNADNSLGGFAPLSAGGTSLGNAATVNSLSGFEVDVPDAPEWHIGGGFEFTVKSRWALFLDARYYTYSGQFNMIVNGAGNLGVAVPNDSVYLQDAGPNNQYGAIQVTSGGLIDGGSWVPTPTAPEGTDCTVSKQNCSFTGAPDGVPDPGMYYIQAGNVRYNGLSLQIGVRFTF